MRQEITLTALREYSRQDLGVGTPAAFLFDEQGRQYNKELVQLSIALRTAEALERQNELLERPLAPTDEHRRRVGQEHPADDPVILTIPVTVPAGYSPHFRALVKSWYHQVGIGYFNDMVCGCAACVQHMGDKEYAAHTPETDYTYQLLMRAEHVAPFLMEWGMAMQQEGGVANG